MSLPGAVKNKNNLKRNQLTQQIQQCAGYEIGKTLTDHKDCLAVLPERD